MSVSRQLAPVDASLGTAPGRATNDYVRVYFICLITRLFLENPGKLGTSLFRSILRIIDLQPLGRRHTFST